MMKTLLLAILMVLSSVIIMLNVTGRKTEVLQKFDKVDKVLVEKSLREMHLMYEGKILKTYKVALGDDPVGHKVKEGDEKTPEGIYTLDWRNPRSSCYKSIHISYPNDKDLLNAKRLNVSPGGNIMIHGLHPSIRWMGSWHYKDDWTDGCIAVTNEEMDEIWENVKNGTKIEIRK